MNILKQTIRLINKNRRTSVFLIFSLFVGLTSFLLISARVNYHRSFDSHVPGYRQIYRVVSSAYTDNVLTVSQPRCQRALGETLEKEFPEVEATGYLCGVVENHFIIGDELFTNDNAFHCSNSFLKLFNIQPLQGNLQSLLTRPYTAIVSESFARKYFPDENPVGKSIYNTPGDKSRSRRFTRIYPQTRTFTPIFCFRFMITCTCPRH
ncbi:MAG: ABC transporter permease [Draconibacterium sp.]|nr:ABC transporter permease [Draconibacterium sp.]